MDWRHFESKLLAASAYDDRKRILYLRFRSGEIYRYFGFPEQQYPELLDAESRPIFPEPYSEPVPLRTTG